MQNEKAVAEAMKQTAKNQLEKPRTIQDAITSLKPLIEQALPRHLTADRVMQTAINYVRQNPAIAKCTEQSLLGAIIQASLTGLELIPSFGQVYLIPYKANKGTRDSPRWIDEVQFQIGYKGLLKLAYNTKEIKDIYTEIVREGDHFLCEKGDNPKIEHIPKLDCQQNKVLCAYAICHLNSGGVVRKVLWPHEIEELRLRNKMQKDNPSGAWATDYEEMAQAKVLKKLLKTLPLSSEIQEAIQSDGAIISEKSFTNNQKGIDMQAIEYAKDQWITEYDMTEIERSKDA